MITKNNIETPNTIVRYELFKNDHKTFLSMTSLTVNEFNLLSQPFQETLKSLKIKDGENDLDKNKGGRPSVLDDPQDKLFFILFYLKLYPLQQVIGSLFGLSQSRANYWIHFLSDVLRTTLKNMNFLPERKASELLQQLECEEQQCLSIDGTERPINRPKDDEKQKKYYSGKKKRHTVKNLIIIGNDDREVKYLSDTVEGKKHDKKAMDESIIVFPKDSTVYQDTGFQGHDPEDVNTVQPQKKPRGKELTSEEKQTNSLISSVRVVVEHVIAGIKRLHIVKSVFRNTKDDYDDLVMLLACGLHNFRNFNRNSVLAS